MLYYVCLALCLEFSFQVEIKEIILVNMDINIKVYFIENTKHNFYTQKPKEIATKISEFLK